MPRKKTGGQLRSPSKFLGVHFVWWRYLLWSRAVASGPFVEPYNTVLCSHSSLEHTDFAVMMDNGAMDIEPNRLLAHFISH